MFVEKSSAKASHIFFNKKYWHIWDINFWNFHETLTNDVVSFEQPGPEMYLRFAFAADDMLSCFGPSLLFNYLFLLRNMRLAGVFYPLLCNRICHSSRQFVWFRGIA